jgi:hypothetical protein
MLSVDHLTEATHNCFVTTTEVSITPFMPVPMNFISLISLGELAVFTWHD